MFKKILARFEKKGSGGVLVGLYLSVKTLKNEKKRREKKEKKKKEKGRILVLKFRTFPMLGTKFSCRRPEPRPPRV